MISAKKIRITVSSAIKLIDLLDDMARKADSESTKKILLLAAIRIADLALAQESAPRRTTRAA